MGQPHPGWVRGRDVIAADAGRTAYPGKDPKCDRRGSETVVRDIQLPLKEGSHRGVQLSTGLEARTAGLVPDENRGQLTRHRHLRS